MTSGGVREQRQQIKTFSIYFSVRDVGHPPLLVFHYNLQSTLARTRNSIYLHLQETLRVSIIQFAFCLYIPPPRNESMASWHQQELIASPSFPQVTTSLLSLENYSIYHTQPRRIGVNPKPPPYLKNLRMAPLAQPIKTQYSSEKKSRLYFFCSRNMRR